ncbi:MAG: BlaI/MecI/CopY family transcriptional regulator [Armatimonadota bacterium]
MAQRDELNLPVFRPGKKGLQKTLGSLETMVMDAVWEAGEPVSVEQVRSKLEEAGKQSAYTTVMTTMSRLFKKGLLQREMRGKAYYYTPAVSREELDSNITRQVVDALLTTFAEPAMSYFVEALSENDPDKLDSLAEMIEQKRQDEQEE